MNSQPQCPNCGGYRVKWWPIYDVSAMSLLNRNTTLRVFGPIAGIAALAVLLLLFRSPLVFRYLGLVWAIFAVLGVVVLFSWRSALRSRTVLRYEALCELDGYRWSWEPGEEQQRVAARPDLIQKGAAKLEAEEEERRRRMD